MSDKDWKIRTSLQIVSANANISSPDVIFIRAFCFPRETSRVTSVSAMFEG